MKRRNMTAFWLLLSGVMTAFSLALVLITSLVGHEIQKRVIAYAAEYHGNAKVHLMEVDRNLTVRFYLPNVGGCCLSWSPDGRRIAFVARLDKRPEIFMIDIFNGDVQQLTYNDADDDFPAWSPDNRTIAYASSLYGNKDIFTVDAETRQIHQFTDSPFAEDSPFWSANGHQLAFTFYPNPQFEIHSIDMEDGKLRSITSASGLAWTSFAPDGRQIIYGSLEAGSYDIYSMNADGTNKRQLTQDLASDVHPVWSPDGHYIAFASNRDGDEEIYVMNADGTNQRQLTHDSWDQLGPSWSPDGRQILFFATPDLSTEIYVIDVDGANESMLVAHASSILPAWQP